MKCKLFAGLFVLLPCLLGLTGSPVYRPTLLVLKSQNCGPCIDWANAYNAPNPAFRQWINDTFRMKDALMIESAKGQEVAGRYGVTRVPTFLVVDDSGRLLHSVTGFNSANELARKLIAGASVRSVRKEPIRGNSQSLTRPDTTPRPTIPNPTEANAEGWDPNPGGAAVDRLTEANQRLEQKAEALKLKAELAERDLHEQTERFRLRTLAQKNEQNKELDTKPGESFEQQPATPFTLPAEPSPPERSVLGKIINSGIGLALELGLTQVQSEVFVPIAAASGPAGAVAYAAFLLWRRRKKKGGARAGPNAEPFQQAKTEGLPLPRKLDEARQLLRLDKSEGRHPIHDALFGSLASAELELLIAEGDQTAIQLSDRLNRRMNDIAPLSTDIPDRNPDQ